MDLNDVRTVWTVLSFAAFLGIVAWAYSGKRKARFDEAARLALDDDAGHPLPGSSEPPGFGKHSGSNEHPEPSKASGQGRTL